MGQTIFELYVSLGDRGIKNKCISTYKRNKDVYGVFVWAVMRVCVSVYLWLIHRALRNETHHARPRSIKKAATSTLSMIAVENDKIAPAEEEPHPGLIEQMKV